MGINWAGQSECIQNSWQWLWSTPYSRRLILSLSAKKCWTQSLVQYDILSSNLPFYVVSISKIVPLNTAIRGRQYILIAVNHLTKWAKASSAALVTAKNIEYLLLNFIFSLHGSTRVLLPNDGLNFTLHGVTELSSLFGTCLTFSAPYHLATNGAVERSNGTLVFILLKMAAAGLFNSPSI